MKIIVTHASPDLDAIISVWLLKKFLLGWADAQVQFVPAGERIGSIKYDVSSIKDPIEKNGEDEIIHVDTGLGPLDHHQTNDQRVSAASLTWDFVQKGIKGGDRWEEKKQAIDRIVKIVVDTDHFKEVFWPDPSSDVYEFSLLGLLDGLKLYKPDQDQLYVDFVIECFEAILHEFENRLWAEKEIKENGKVFETKFGKGIGFETINDTVVKLSQKMGFVVVIRKDPRKGYVRIKALPDGRINTNTTNKQISNKPIGIDLTLVYEKLRKMDPDATWFLHVSKKMLLNGSVKNPKMKPTSLSLDDIIKVVKNI